MIKKIFIYIIFSLCSYVIYSQDIISGKVMDKQTGEPLAYANIRVVDENAGTVTNEKGQYSINIKGADTLLFMYLGYKSRKISIQELKKEPNVQLRTNAVELQEVEVTNRNLSAEEIINTVVDNFKENHKALSGKQKFFYHKYDQTPFSKKNKLELKKSNFSGMDRETFDELVDLIPENIIDYKDLVADLYLYNSKVKLVPEEGISLEKGSQKHLMQKAEKKLEKVMAELGKSKNDEDVYYKIRTSIFGKKITGVDDDENDFPQPDSTTYPIYTSFVKAEMLILLYDFTHIDSDNYEFLTKTKRYIYKKEDLQFLNGELTYKISFVPQKKGLFQGTVYVSADNFALLRADFEYAPGKESENFQLFGLGHSLKYKKGRVIFEKGDSTYLVKYVSSVQKEYGSVDRNFVFLKKKERFLFDKTLSKMKLSADLAFDVYSQKELLIMDRSGIKEEEFKKIEEPKVTKYKRKYTYDPDMWNHRTTLSPSDELEDLSK